MRMTRKFIWLFAVILALPAWAAEMPGIISGTVWDSSGVVSAARVELFADSLIPAATVFTDAAGFFRASNLSPGIYNVKVSAPSLLPVLRPGLSLRSGADLVLNITLNTLFEAIQAMPARRSGVQDQDDWKWILRSTANRPILRVFDDPVTATAPRVAVPLNGEMAFVAGSDAGALGSSYDMTTAFMLARPLFSSGTLAVGGNVGYGAGAEAPETVLRASYSRSLPDGSKPQVAFALWRLAGPQMTEHDALQALVLSVSDQVSLAGRLGLKFGSSYQTVQFGGTVSAVNPFGSIDFNVSPNTVLEYQYATALPNPGTEDFDAASTDLGASAPRLSLTNSNAVLERARHQEVSLSRHFGKNNLQVAGYRDQISDPALTGIGTMTNESGDFLPDAYSGTFAWNGPGLATRGIRAMLQRQLASGLTAAVDYSYGGVLAVAQPGVNWPQLSSSITTQDRHSITGKVSGAIRQSRTQWRASYQWINGAYALTRVDMFDASAGQADPYLSIFVRQPIPGTAFMPVRLEALIDVRNLLAQGYVPIVGNSGRTLYLAESARVFRGGVAFTF